MQSSGIRHVTFAQLRAEGFDEEILEALDALTKRKGESRLQAAARAKQNQLAKRVKLADNQDNMDIRRIKSPVDSDLARLREYEEVRALLLS